MTEEISYYDEDLTELIAEIERGIEGLRKLSPVAKTQVLRPPKAPATRHLARGGAVAARRASSLMLGSTVRRPSPPVLAAGH